MPEYVFDNAGAQASSRFSALEELFDPVTVRYLTACGVSAGWHCLEVGGGSGSVARWLAQRVGPTGRLLVTDIDTRFLSNLVAPSVEVRHHDIVLDPLDKAAFDLAHTRLVLVHLPARERAIANMVAALKPGGWLVLQEFGGALPADPARFPGERLLKTQVAYRQVMDDRGVDADLGRKLLRMLASLGLEEVEAEGHVTLFAGGSAGARLTRANFEQLREEILATHGVSEQEFEDDLAQLNDPDMTWPSSILWTVRARRP